MASPISGPPRLLPFDQPHPLTPHPFLHLPTRVLGTAMRCVARRRARSVRPSVRRRRRRRRRTCVR